jgi:hypothetical protein
MRLPALRFTGHSDKQPRYPLSSSSLSLGSRSGTPSLEMLDLLFHDRCKPLLRFDGSL